MLSDERPPCPAAEAVGDTRLFGDLIERARAGCQDAARTLYERYNRHILSVVRRHFLPTAAPLRRDLDSGDLVQEAWGSLFAVLRQGRAFLTPEDLKRFMVTLAGNHFRKHYRARVTARKRSLNREEALDPATHDLAATGTDPAEQVAAADECQHLLAGLPEQDRPVLLAVRDGERLCEVASRLGISLRTAERIVERARRSGRARQTPRPQAR
jgi:RNA polymerase sigma factor (sigma-70 family)